MRPVQFFSAFLLSVTLRIVSGGSQTTYSSSDAQSPLALTLIREEDGTCTVVSVAHTQTHRLLSAYDDDVVVETTPLVTGTLSSGASEKLQVIGHVGFNLWERARDLCPDLATQDGLADFSQRVHDNQQSLSATHPTKQPELELHPLVVSGPSRNRVDLTFFSDGYTIDEKEKFLADAKRLAQDMSQNQTFSTVRPLMNFWAAFAPSRESGIGVGGTPKDTAFGLYRDGTELRAVYSSKRDVARDACFSLRSQCDYPILLGNDPLYGGLGGEFTISTASELNGALVLRHELGHSMIDVGEEYDGGYAYFGVNAAQNVSQSSSWSHWLSTSLPPGTHPREERAVMPFQAYPWTILNKTSPWSAEFTSSGSYDRHLVRFSLSGLPQKEGLKVKLDGKDLGWEPRPDVHLDRWHYDLHSAEALARGPHQLSFMLGDSAQEGTAQLCSAEIIEYGDESEFNSAPGYYGAFPTFSNQNLTTFRPTNEQCLMRIVTSPSLCHVCLEGLWLSLLKRVSLIDQFTVTIPDNNRHSDPTVMDLTLVPLGQLREPEADKSAGEFYSIIWEKDGMCLPAFDNLTSIAVKGDVRGTWRANVRLHTSEIRADPDHLTTQWAGVWIGPELVPEPKVHGTIDSANYCE